MSNPDPLRTDGLAESGGKPPIWPSVSVVIPVFNRTEYLEAAIRSVLDQDYDGKLHVVVVDDGSDDSIAEQFADRLPAVTWLRQPNRGLGAARQAGSMATDTDLITYQDDDDLWRPGRLRTQVEFLRRHPDVGAVCGDICHFSPDGRRDPPFFKRYESLHEAPRRSTEAGGSDWVVERRALLNLVLIGVPPFAQSLVIRRDFFMQIGGWNESVRLYSECFDFFVRATLAGEVGFVDDVMVDIRRGHEHMTSDQDRSVFLESRNLFRWAKTLRGFPAEQVLPRLVVRFVGAARRHRRAGRFGEAARLMRWACALACRAPRALFRRPWRVDGS